MSMGSMRFGANDVDDVASSLSSVYSRSLFMLSCRRSIGTAFAFSANFNAKLDL